MEDRHRKPKQGDFIFNLEEMIILQQNYRKKRHLKEGLLCSLLKLQDSKIGRSLDEIGALEDNEGEVFSR